MLPSLGFSEIILLAVLALVVVGPKDLPLMMRKLGRWTAKLRGMAQEFRSGFDELARQAELDELRKEVDALRRTTNLSSIAHDIQKPLPTLESYAGVTAPPPSLVEHQPVPDAGSAEPQMTSTVTHIGDRRPGPLNGAAQTVETPEQLSSEAAAEPVARSAP
jgi:sec-independent protein translocase protein TatB